MIRDRVMRLVRVVPSLCEGTFVVHIGVVAVRGMTAHVIRSGVTRRSVVVVSVPVALMGVERPVRRQPHSLEDQTKSKDDRDYRSPSAPWGGLVPRQASDHVGRG
ncbi:MAG TPA: hypothetical protein DEA08_09450 [Planctomycetes bacterium]|nr:hypothetical protein [Planctomycetota bacterium]|tara:strand:+ start:632 stop:946 length:315 start_codon:yes stop_codon:yes gene_type:complete